MTDFQDIHNELKKNLLSKPLELLYRILKGNKKSLVAKLFLRYIIKLEGSAYTSYTARKIMARDYKVSIGVHSYGEVFVPKAFEAGVTIGKFCSIGREVKVITANHPIDNLSTHPYFYYKKDTGQNANSQLKLDIGNDVWIGHRAIILPGCTMIGDGAIIGAGAIVTRNIEPFSIVAGSPAREIKKRFDNKTIQSIYKDPWWDKSLTELKKDKLIPSCE